MSAALITLGALVVAIGPPMATGFVFAPWIDDSDSDASFALRLLVTAIVAVAVTFGAIWAYIALVGPVSLK